MNAKELSTLGHSATTYAFKLANAAVVTMLLLAGCQAGITDKGPPAVSLEEAKKITGTFESGAFTPPPRTINDITAILAKETPDDLKSYQKALALAESKPPSTKQAEELADFYFSRGFAAYEVGRAKQMIDDFRLVVKYGTVSGYKCLNLAIWGLGAAEWRAGNWSHGIQNLERALSSADSEVTKSIMAAALSPIYAYSGDLVAAKKALAQAHKERTVTKSWESFDKEWGPQLDALINVGQGRLLGAMGRLTEGEGHLRKAVAMHQRYTSKPWPACYDSTIRRQEVQNNMVAGVANNLRRQGRLVEAEIFARYGVEQALRSHGRYSPHTGRVLIELNRVILEQGRYAEAEALARANLEIYERIKAADDSARMAEARSILSDAIFLQRRWREALSEYDGIRTALKTDPAAYEGFIGGNVNLWLALIKGGRGAEGLTLARSTLEKKRAVLGEGHYDTAEARGVLAMALAETGDREQALREFARAVPILLRRTSRSEGVGTTQTARDFRLGLILDAYIQLLANIRGTADESKVGIDAAAEAFRLADVARGRTVKRALAASSARAAAKDPALADLARREQDAITQIGALNGLLSNVMSAPPNEQKPEVIEDLRSRIGRLQAARVALMKEIETHFPDYANLIDPKPVSIDEVRSNLRPAEALIATYVGEEQSYVWAIPHSGPIAFASAALGAKEINQIVSVLRASLNPRAKTLGDIPSVDLETAYKLYASLLRPVESGWKGAKNLIVIAHGALGFLPFSVLPTKPVTLGQETKPLFSNYRAVPWLARTHAVTVLPSVTSLRTLRTLPPGDIGRRAFTGFGNPYFSLAQASREKPKTQVASAGTVRGFALNRRGMYIATAMDSARIGVLPALPDTAEEVKSIARALKADLKRDVFLGKAANEGQVKSMDLSKIKVLVFATHGLLPGDLDGLTQPALALSSPEVAGGKDDGLLTLGEILGLRLNADWVVLSACNTGAGEGAGAEAVSGLGRAFFYAGTRALLVSNWPVETTSAKTLTTELFRRQAADPTLSRSEALNRTMLDLIDRSGYMDAEGRMVFSYAHPVFWAPFSLVGDGG